VIDLIKESERTTVSGTARKHKLFRE